MEEQASNEAILPVEEESSVGEDADPSIISSRVDGGEKFDKDDASSRVEDAASSPKGGIVVPSGPSSEKEDSPPSSSALQDKEQEEIESSKQEKPGSQEEDGGRDVSSGSLQPENETLESVVPSIQVEGEDDPQDGVSESVVPSMLVEASSGLQDEISESAVPSLQAKVSSGLQDEASESVVPSMLVEVSSGPQDELSESVVPSLQGEVSSGPRDELSVLSTQVEVEGTSSDEALESVVPSLQVEVSSGPQDVPSTQVGASSDEALEFVEPSTPVEASANSQDKTLESVVEVASPNDVFKEPQSKNTHHPLSLSWSFGFNAKLPVHNISEGNRKMIFYVCAHTGVLFDCANNKQCLLQGHNNPISCTAVSRDRRWLATADSGKDCVLIVWDSFSGIPVRTIFDGLGEGTIAVAMSPDSQYLATISSGYSQVVSIWEWTVESKTPLWQATLEEDYSYQTYLTFHHSDTHQLVSNSEDMVIFYHCKGDEINYHSHPILDKDFNKTLGAYSQSVFVPNSSLGLTVTSEGLGIVWGLTDTGNVHEPHVKSGVKLMKLHDSPITVLTSIMEEIVVTGDKEGRIKFFDRELKLINWYDSTMRFGPLCSISFAHSPEISRLKSMLSTEKNDIEMDHSYPEESTKAASPFIIPNFTISTGFACVAHITTNSSAIEIVLNEHNGAVNTLATHPYLHRILIGSYACKIKLWDYDTKLVLASRDFGEPNYVQCVAFDPKGEFISIGFTNGTLQVLDSLTLDDACQPFRYSRDAVTHVAFSHDSSFMAAADLDMCVSVYVAGNNGDEDPWQFLAKYRSHYKKIEGLLFGVKLDSDAPWLLSLGSDRLLVEYDLANSTEDDLRILSSDRIEQSSIPMAMAWYPPLTKESFLLTVNNQYKIKLYNSTTKMCRKTLLGPAFGSPLTKVIVLPAPVVRNSDMEEVRRYLAYSTNSKVGLLLLPHDGNPHNAKGLVAHPGLIADITCSFDGKHIFTAGGEDCTVSMWNVNTDALEASALLGGADLKPFYAMLEGGREGEFFKELEEYFYYAQIRSQGPDVTSVRKASTTIPIEQIPYIMRAIGFYPSEQEIEDMLNEVKFSKYVDSGTYVTDINLGNLIRLYINHRPVFGLSPLQIGHAFKVLGERVEDEKYWSTNKGRLLALMQENGEHLTEAEIVEYLMTLMGYSDNPEVDGSFTEDVAVALGQISDRITAPMFAEEIIGLTTAQQQ